jgi:hypothetical protein
VSSSSSWRERSWMSSGACGSVRQACPLSLRLRRARITRATADARLASCYEDDFGEFSAGSASGGLEPVRAHLQRLASFRSARTDGCRSPLSVRLTQA